MSTASGASTAIPHERSRRFRLLVPGYFEVEIAHGSSVEGRCASREMFAMEGIIFVIVLGVFRREDSLNSTGYGQVCFTK